MGSGASVTCIPDYLKRGRKRPFDVSNVNNAFRVLVIGTGNSGKSTILKQIKILLGDGFSHEELKLLRPNVFDSIVSSMNMLTKYMKDYNVSFNDINRLTDAATSNTAAEAGESRQPFTEGLSSALEGLWNDDAVKATLTLHGDSIHVPNGSEYLFGHLERISSLNYVPSYQDILECRTTTAGANAMDIVYAGLTFSVTDMGGQKNARKKWKRLFEEAQGIIFVVALSEYDQNLQEDETTNRMHDALSAFSEVVNSPVLRDVPIVLLFNKMDIFRKKVETTPITVAFKDYDGDDGWEPALDYIKEEFLKQIHGNARSLKRKGTIFSFYTYGTSTEKMGEIIGAVFDIMKTKIFYSVF